MCSMSEEMIQNLAKSIVRAFLQGLKQQGGDNE
jgi:hypothetical protein